MARRRYGATYCFQLVGPELALGLAGVQLDLLGLALAAALNTGEGEDLD